MANEPAIRVENVSKLFKLPHEKNSSIKTAFVNFYRRNKSYELQKALENISFEVKKGEFFGIIGRNGSGKSTMLKLLAGIYTPTEGQVHVRGHLTPFIELGVGFNPELTGRENVYLNGALLGFSRKEVDAMYDDIVAFAEIERFMDQKLKNYSSGMQVRLAFSIAIRAQTDILLIDEVLAVGDQSFQEKCFAYFEDIRRTGKTVILISHDGGVIERFCERVAIIDKGQLVDIGEPRAMVYKYGAIIANEQYKDKDEVSEKEHQGTGELKITGVELIGPSGKPSHSLEFGQPFKVRLTYKVDTPVTDNVIVGVDLIDDKDVSVLGPNTKESGKVTFKPRKKGSVEAAFSINPLSPGSYSVTAGMFNSKATFAYDLVERALEFKIIGEARHGKIYIEPRWSFTEDSK